jgi:isopentenyl diphosphate isomerase/L-lactate dehydrogenase-like FMN-dependent dehydrogenase
MLGTKVDIPFYVTATALGKLGNPEGEVVLTRGAKKHNVIQMIPTLASCSFDEIMDAADDQVQWLQLYVNKDREVTKRIVQHAEKRGCKVSSDRLVRLIAAKFSKRVSLSPLMRRSSVVARKICDRSSMMSVLTSKAALEAQ